MEEKTGNMNLSLPEDIMIAHLCADIPGEPDKLELFRAGFMAGKYATKLKDIFLYLPINQIQVNIFQEILEERTRQDKKFGENRDQDHMLWLTILAEEFGEVANAILEKKDRNELNKEIIQCAAVAVAWIENIYRRAHIEVQNQFKEEIEKHGKSVIQPIVEDYPIPELPDCPQEAKK